jgi:GDP-L-fucose synthase
MIPETVLKTFEARNVLVTGGTGLIGRQVIDLLSVAGAHIRSVSLDTIIVNSKAEHILGDLADFKFCKEIARDMDYVFHIAGIQGTVQTSSSKPASHFVPTLMMNTNMLEAARLRKVRKLVFTSSIGAYAEGRILRESDYRVESVPMSFAGWAKRIAELQVHSYKIQYGIETFSIVRLSNVYGPGDNFNPASAMVIPSLIYRISAGEDPLVVWGDGSAVRDFLYSRDAAEGIVLALHHGTGDGFVNIGSGTGHSIRDILDTLRSFMKFNYTFDPDRPSGADARVMDISKAKKLLGFVPKTDLSAGLKLTWDWFMNNPGEHKKKIDYFAGSD